MPESEALLNPLPVPSAGPTAVTDAAPVRTTLARLERYAATRDGRDLWPDISVPAFRAAERELARVGAAVIGGARGPATLRSHPGADARALGVAARAAGMGALLGYWCETGQIVADADVTAVFALHLDHSRRRAARLRGELDRVLVALDDHGVEVAVIKGTHTGARYFPEPSTRTASDVDLLVAPGDWVRARGVLEELGFEAADSRAGDVLAMSDTLAMKRPGSGDPVPILEYTDALCPWTVDLHRSLGWTYFAGLTATLGDFDVHAGEVWHEFARPVRVLPQPLLLAYLALHTSGHFYSMKQARLFELVLVAQQDFGRDVERWRALDRLISKSDSGRFIFPALDLAERLVPGTIDPLVLAHAAAASPRRLRRLVRRTEPAWGQRLHPFPGLRERFVWVRSPREVLAALTWLMWPRDGERPASLTKALGAQWRRVRRTLRRFRRRGGLR